MAERRGAAERQAEDGAQVVLELARLGAFDRPVAGVVHARRHLVRDQLPLRDEELDREHADVVEVLEDALQVRLGRASAAPALRCGASVRRRMPSSCVFATSG